MDHQVPNPLPDLLLARLERPACDTVGQWLPRWRSAMDDHARADPFTAAIAAARQADRMAWAFFSGYQGALQAAFPALRAQGPVRLASLCANEAGRKLTEIDTTLREEGDAWRLDGRKSWVLAGLGDLELQVLARVAGGPPRGPGSLAIVRVPGGGTGVAIGPARLQAVLPELPHAEVAFAQVRIERAQWVEGDGYADHVRPFRLREDLFVSGCTLAFLLSQAHADGWPMPWRQRCMGAIVALHECTRLAPTEAATELVAAGVLALAGDLIEQAGPLWALDPAGAPGAERWRRDQPILALGKEARRQRVVSAWAKAGWAAADPGRVGSGE